MLDDDGAHDAGGLIDLFLDGDALDHVAEFDLAGLLGEDRDVVRIPFHEVLALLDLLAVADVDDGADDDGVTLEFAAILAVDGDGAVLVEGDPGAVEGLDGAQIVEADLAVVLGLDDRLLEGAGGGAADVEGTHGELRAGLADGLRGDDADGLAELHRQAGGQVAAVALDADAALGLAGEHGADLQLLDGRSSRWLCAVSSSINWSRLSSALPVTGSLTVSQLTRPMMRWLRSTTSSSPS